MAHLIILQEATLRNYLEAFPAVLNITKRERVGASGRREKKQALHRSISQLAFLFHSVSYFHYWFCT